MSHFVHLEHAEAAFLRILITKRISVKEGDLKSNGKQYS
jgi:hypothetical protein